MRPASPGSCARISSKLRGVALKFPFRSMSIEAIHSASSSVSPTPAKSSFAAASRSRETVAATSLSSAARSAIARKEGLSLSSFPRKSSSIEPNRWTRTRSKALHSLPQQGSVPWWE